MLVAYNTDAAALQLPVLYVSFSSYAGDSDATDVWLRLFSEYTAFLDFYPV